MQIRLIYSCLFLILQYIPFVYLENKRATSRWNQRDIFVLECTSTICTMLLSLQSIDRFLPTRACSRKISDNDAEKKNKNAGASRAHRIAQITHETILMKPVRHKGLQIQSPRKRER